MNKEAIQEIKQGWDIQDVSDEEVYRQAKNTFTYTGAVFRLAVSRLSWDLAECFLIVRLMNFLCKAKK